VPAPQSPRTSLGWLSSLFVNTPHVFAKPHDELQRTGGVESRIHSLKFGFILMRDYYARKDCNECNGDVTFNPLSLACRSTGQTGSAYAGFLLGLPFSGQYSFGGDFDSTRPTTRWFVQDDLR